MNINMNIIDNFLNIAGNTMNKKLDRPSQLRIAIGFYNSDEIKNMAELFSNSIFNICGQRPSSVTFNSKCYIELESKKLGVILYIFNMLYDSNKMSKYLYEFKYRRFNYYSMSELVIDDLVKYSGNTTSISLDESISKNLSLVRVCSLLDARYNELYLYENKRVIDVNKGGATKIKRLKDLDKKYTSTMDVLSMYPDFDAIDKFVGYCKADLDILTETVQATLANITKEGEDNMALKIKDVIFNNPATIVFWNDGTKTVVQAREDDAYDREKGLAMAISKKVMGNKRNYYETYKKWIGKDDKKHNK